MPTASDVLDYWFGEPARSEPELMEKISRWFMGGPALDREVNERFGGALDAAIAGQLDDWADAPRSRLALVILLDQLTRNRFRDDPKMYSGDTKAQQLAVRSFEDGTADKLELVEKLFLAMPLLHAEDLALQQRAGVIGAALREEAPPLYEKMLAMHHEQTQKYTEVIRRFGRFPHRNAILGRESTPEEIEFLRDWADRAPPKGSLPASGSG